MGAEKVPQMLKQKTSIEKLKTILKRKHYDVACNFAEKDGYPYEVIAEIWRIYGDSCYEKVVKEVISRECTVKQLISIREL